MQKIKIGQLGLIMTLTPTMLIGVGTVFVANTNMEPSLIATTNVEDL